MKKLNKYQIIGLGVLLIGITTPFLFKISAIKTISGVISAIGIGLILKWIPFKKRKHKILKEIE